MRRFKKLPGGIYPYYLAWQWGAYKLAQRIHAKEKFDRVHHITFVSARHPSFMGGLKIPFFFGPVAGGESAPLHLRAAYPLRGLIIDGLRDVTNFLARFDPFLRQTFRQASKIFVTSEQTLGLIPICFRHKASIQLAIGLDKKWLEPISTSNRAAKERQVTKILYVGRFLYWKGMDLGLLAFAKYADKNPEAKLTMIGQGPEEQEWMDLAKRLGIDHRITWLPWVSQNDLPSLYQRHHLLLFPSLHDSGGLVVLEAMAHGLPVICLDLGGPGIIVNHSSGISVPTRYSSPKEVITGIEKALITIGNNKALYEKLCIGALKRASEYNWSCILSKLYD